MGNALTVRSEKFSWGPRGSEVTFFWVSTCFQRDLFLLPITAISEEFSLTSTATAIEERKKISIIKINKKVLTLIGILPPCC